MKDIVKVLLAEGIDEETIHEVLDIISEVNPEDADKVSHERQIRYARARKKYVKNT